MKEILPDILNWLVDDEPIALAIVVETWGSSPRKAGAKMALTPGGKISGSVSGGCVEAAVFEAGVETLKTGHPKLLHYGVADEEAWQVGLACGGMIDIFVKPLNRAFFERQRMEIESNRRFAVVTVLQGPDQLLGREILVTENGEVTDALGEGLDGILIEKACQAISERRSQRFSLSPATVTLQFFVDVTNPPPTLIIVGGVHTAIALTSIAKTLGFQTVVVDPRKAFGSQERFPHVDRLIQSWPDEAFSSIDINTETAIAMFTHDPKIDDPAIKIALNSPAFYIGALGSPKTQEKRRHRLMGEGFTADQIDRIHGPIGIEIGGETPEEIALAVMAEIVAAYHRPNGGNPK
jgi:xanthine dehydrogenase accessory factor